MPLLIGLISLPAITLSNESLLSRMKRRVAAFNSDQIKGTAAAIGSAVLGYAALSTLPLHNWIIDADEGESFPLKYTLTSIPFRVYRSLNNMLIKRNQTSTIELEMILTAQGIGAAVGSYLLGKYAYKKLDLAKPTQRIVNRIRAKRPVAKPGLTLN